MLASLTRPCPPACKRIEPRAGDAQPGDGHFRRCWCSSDTCYADPWPSGFCTRISVPCASRAMVVTSLRPHKAFRTHWLSVAASAAGAAVRGAAGADPESKLLRGSACVAMARAVDVPQSAHAPPAPLPASASARPPPAPSRPGETRPRGRAAGGSRSWRGPASCGTGPASAIPWPAATEPDAARAGRACSGETRACARSSAATCPRCPPPRRPPPPPLRPPLPHSTARPRPQPPCQALGSRHGPGASRGGARGARGGTGGGGPRPRWGWRLPRSRRMWQGRAVAGYCGPGRQTDWGPSGGTFPCQSTRRLVVVAVVVSAAVGRESTGGRACRAGSVSRAGTAWAVTRRRTAWRRRAGGGRRRLVGATTWAAGPQGRAEPDDGPTVPGRTGGTGARLARAADRGCSRVLTRWTRVRFPGPVPRSTPPPMPPTRARPTRPPHDRRPAGGGGSGGEGSGRPLGAPLHIVCCRASVQRKVAEGRYT